MSLQVIEPATEAGDGGAAAGRGRGGRRGGRAGEGGLPGLARRRPRRPRGAAAPASPTRSRPQQEALATLEARNAGKPIGDARGEIGMVVETFRYYAGAPERLLGETIPVAGGVDMTFREPLGVVGLIVPWNFPLVIASWKVAPALAAGNTIVLKPAELTPLTRARAGADRARGRAARRACSTSSPGPGSVCGKRLVEHPDVAKIAFTGSTEVGRGIAAGAAATIKRVTLELGGKSANVVFADADLEAAAAAAPVAVFGNAGQDCCARSRILVERSAARRLLAALAPEVEAIAVGDPLDEATEMGPLISAGQREAVASFVPDDAPVAIRGGAPEGPGFWFPPTVLAPVANDERAAREEIFGPVACVIPFADEDEAVPLANDDDLRALRLDLDPRRRPRPARRAGDRHRRDLDQLEHLGAGIDPVRRLQAVRRRPRARPRRARRTTPSVKNVYYATEED